MRIIYTIKYDFDLKKDSANPLNIVPFSKILKRPAVLNQPSSWLSGICKNCGELNSILPDGPRRFNCFNCLEPIQVILK